MFDSRTDAPYTWVDGERGLRVHEPGAFDGFTLLAPLRSKRVYLLGMDGVVVHTWTTNHLPSGGAHLLSGGRLLRACVPDRNPRFRGGGIGGRIEELAWDDRVLWSFELATDERTLHHDVLPLPNGNVLAIAWQHVSPDEALRRGRAVDCVGPEGLWFDQVLEIRPIHPTGGEIVWSWRSIDHLVQDTRAELASHGRPAEHPGRIDINADHRFDPAPSAAETERRTKLVQGMAALGYGGASTSREPGAAADARHDPDWLHLNSLAYLPEEDLIALSAPHLNELWVIDHSTTTAEAAGSSGGGRGHGGDLLYRFGDPRNYGCGDATNRELWFQHSVSWLRRAETGRLGLLVFDNGTGRPEGDYSRVLELDLPFDPSRGFERANGAAFGPRVPSWCYSEPGRLFSPFVSGAERLPNGNTLVCEGARGRVLEVTREGRIVWDFYNPLGGEVPAVKRAGNTPSKALFSASRIARGDPRLANLW